MFASYIQTVRGFRRSVWLFLLAIALIGFTYDGGIYAVLFNLYLLRLGFGPDFVGQVNSAGTLAFALCAIPAGALGTRWGNRRLMIVGVVVMFVGSLLLPLSGFGPQPLIGSTIIVAYMLTNLGVAFFFVNSVPYLIGITSLDERNAVFSVQSALLSLAAFVGSLLAGFLPAYFALLFAQTLDQPEPYRYPLLLAALLLLIGLWALLRTRLEPEHLAQTRSTTSGDTEEPGGSIWVLIGGLTLVRLLFVVGSAVAMTFFNVYMDAGLQVPTAQIGIAISISRLIAVPAALVTPLLAARWGNAPLALWSSLGVALFLAPLALASTWSGAALAYVGVITMTSIRYPAFMVYSMALIPVRYRSHAAGAGEMAAGLSFAAIALAGGYIILTYGYGALFFAGAAVNLIGTLFFAFFMTMRSAKPLV